MDDGNHLSVALKRMLLWFPKEDVVLFLGQGQAMKLVTGGCVVKPMKAACWHIFNRDS